MLEAKARILLIAQLDCFYLLQFGFLLSTTAVLTTSTWTYVRRVQLLDQRIGTFIGRRPRPCHWGAKARNHRRKCRVQYTYWKTKWN